MGDVIQIFGKRAFETAKETHERKRKETYALVSDCARRAQDYTDFLEASYGKAYAESQGYWRGGEHSAFRAWTNREWIETNYTYDRHRTAEQKQLLEKYRDDIHARYTQELEDLHEKMADPDYVAFINKRGPLLAP